MKTYEIFFEIYGKKLKTTIEANSIDMAKAIIKDKIRFDKITELKSNNNDNNDLLDQMLNMFGMKK